MTKSDLLKATVQELRSRRVPNVDGSYIVVTEKESPVYASVCHPSMTPAQIGVEARLRERGHVYFIRDKQLAAPYWISPQRQAMRRVEVKKKDSDQMVTVTIPHVVFNVSTSRDDRKSYCVEVATPAALLQDMKAAQERAYLLEQMRKAVAMLLDPKPRTDAA